MLVFVSTDTGERVRIQVDMQLPRTSCRSSDSDTDSLIAFHDMLSAFGWKQFSLIGFGIIGGGGDTTRESTELVWNGGGGASL